MQGLVLLIKMIFAKHWPPSQVPSAQSTSPKLTLFVSLFSC